MITVITNGRMLDCVGDEPQEDASIIIEDEKIKDVYSGYKRPPKNASVIDVGRRTLLPGLTDAHAHTTFTEIPHRVYNIPPIITAVKIIRNLNLDLQAGFTTVCGLGGPNWALKQAVAEGLIKGPRMLVACSTICKTGGHGDFSNFRDGLGEWYAKDTGLVSLMRIADGVSEMRKAVREQLRAGADVVKIYATGGVGSANDEVTDLGYSEEEMLAAVEEARDNGKYVAAHCDNDKGIERSIRCGIRVIQHGIGFNEKTALMLKERGSFHVPTLFTYKWLAEKSSEAGAPEYFRTKAAAVMQESIRSAELTYKMKCNVGFGTGCGINCHGNQGVEFKLRRECGWIPYETIKSATIVNARLFRMEDKIGTIEIGKWADIIAVDGHPEKDVELLGNSNNISLVMKAGEILKNTL